MRKYYGEDYSDSYLMHYGRKGQRRGQHLPDIQARIDKFAQRVQAHSEFMNNARGKLGLSTNSDTDNIDQSADEDEEENSDEVLAKKILDRILGRNKPTKYTKADVLAGNGPKDVQLKQRMKKYEDRIYERLNKKLTKFSTKTRRINHSDNGDRVYYGVQPSNTNLAHYGVRGMKWGVRKALARGDRAALSRHYAKAQKKLARLTEQAKTGKGLGTKRALIGGAASALTSGAGTYALNRLRGVDPVTSAKYAGAAALVGGAGGTLLNAGRATKAEKVNAQARRDAWKREMDRTFKGTGVGRNKKSKARKVKTNSKLMNPKAFSSDMKRSITRGSLTGGVLGGALGSSITGGISAARYIKSHPKEYANFKKKYKKMSFRDRVRTSFS